MIAALLMLLTTYISSVSSENAGSDWYSRPNWLPTDSPYYLTPGSDDCQYFRDWKISIITQNLEVVTLTQAVYNARASAESCAAIYNFFCGILDREYYAYEGQSNVWDVSSFGPLASTRETRKEFKPIVNEQKGWDYNWTDRQSTNSISRRFFEYTQLTNAMVYLSGAYSHRNGTINDNNLAPFNPGLWASGDATRSSWPDWRCAFDDESDGDNDKRCIRWWTTKKPASLVIPEWPNWTAWRDNLGCESDQVTWALPNFYDLQGDYLLSTHYDTDTSIYQPTAYGIWSRCTDGNLPSGITWLPTINMSMSEMIETLIYCGDPRRCKSKPKRTHVHNMWMQGLASNTQLLSMYDVTLQDYMPIAGVVSNTTYTAEYEIAADIGPQVVEIIPELVPGGYPYFRAKLEPGLDYSDLTVSISNTTHTTARTYYAYEDDYFHTIDVSKVSSRMIDAYSAGEEFDAQRLCSWFCTNECEPYEDSYTYEGGIYDVTVASLGSTIRDVGVDAYDWASARVDHLWMDSSPFATNAWVWFRIDPYRDPQQGYPEALFDATATITATAVITTNRADGTVDYAIDEFNSGEFELARQSFSRTIYITNAFSQVDDAWPMGQFDITPILTTSITRSYSIAAAVGDIPHFNFRPGWSFWEEGLGVCDGLGGMCINVVTTNGTSRLYRSYNATIESANDFWNGISARWFDCDTRLRTALDITGDPFARIAISQAQLNALAADLRSNVGIEYVDLDVGLATVSPVSWCSSSLDDGRPYLNKNGHAIYLNTLEGFDADSEGDRPIDEWVTNFDNVRHAIEPPSPVFLFASRITGSIDIYAPLGHIPWSDSARSYGTARNVHVNRVKWSFPHCKKE